MEQKDIAAALSVTEGAVSQWINKDKAQEKKVPCHRPSPGAPSKTAD